MASLDIFLTYLRIFFVVADVYALFDIPSEKSAHNFIKMRGGGQRPFIKFIKKTDVLLQESVPKAGREWHIRATPSELEAVKEAGRSWWEEQLLARCISNNWERTLLRLRGRGAIFLKVSRAEATIFFSKWKAAKEGQSLWKRGMLHWYYGTHCFHSLQALWQDMEIKNCFASTCFKIAQQLNKY